MTQQEIYILLPYAILAGGSMFTLLLGAFAPGFGVRRLIYLSAAIAFAAAGCSAFIYSPGTAGVIFVSDGFSRIFTVLASLTATLTLLISVGYVGRRPLGEEEFPALVLFAAFGMSLLASSTNLLGIFLGLECMSLALYIMLASNKADPRSGESGLKYLIIGAVSTGFFAYGIAMIYYESGTLSVTEAMAAISCGGGLSPVGMVGWGMLLVGLGFKTSLFPFHLWAPDVYEGGPAPVVAYLSTASKATVLAAFIRLALASGTGWETLTPALWVICAFTMAFGNIAALTQNNIKRVLAYSSIAQMGYVLLALIAAPKTGPVPAIFYLVVYILMDLGAFGVVASFSGKDGELGDIDTLRGLGFRHPFRSFALAACFISLAGLPPTAGFIGKFGIFFASLKAGYVYLSVIGIITAIISMYYYLRVVVYLYMRSEKEDEARAIQAKPKAIPIEDPAGAFALAVSVALIIYLGVLPGGLLEMLSALAGLTS
jgi:NADH-quinone oxidoreductase subunit N